MASHIAWRHYAIRCDRNDIAGTASAQFSHVGISTQSVATDRAGMIATNIFDAKFAQECDRSIEVSRIFFHFDNADAEGDA